MKTMIGAVIVAGLLGAPAGAQSAASAWNDLPDRFQVDAGYFRIDANTVLRYDSPQGGAGAVDFEQDLGLVEKGNTFWVDGTWRVGRRHQLKLAFTQLSRERSGNTLQRDIVWGGQTYQAGLTTTATTSSEILGGYYRFAIFRNDRFEIGPTVGVGYLWLDARIQATGTLTGPGGGQTRTLDEGRSMGSITGAVGGYTNAWLAKRLVARADYLYIKVSPENSKASVTDWRVAADYYFNRTVGVGAQYKYNQYSYDRGVLKSELGGELTFQGAQVFLTLLF
jgi:hypothetical protein